MPTIERVPTPAVGDEVPHAWVEAMQRLDTAACRELYGHDDFSDSVAARVVGLRGSAYGRLDAWVALDGDTVVGYASAHQPLREDRDTATLDLTVAADARRRGVGSALFAAAVDALAADGRTTLFTWAFSPVADPDPQHAVRAASGTGAVDSRTAGNAFLLHHGFTLEQVERPSTLTLTGEALARAQQLGARASTAAGAHYEVVSWAGPAPDAVAAGLADLEGRMSTDVPMAEDFGEAQAWDVERLRTAERRMTERGSGWTTTIARHVHSDEVAAFTMLQWPGHHPEGVWQEGTLVRPDHRGHRLGMAVKAANLAQLVAANPRAERVHTWNAAENAPMLAINDALGFVPTGVEGTWRRRP